MTTLIDTVTDGDNMPTGGTVSLWATGFIAPSGSPTTSLGWVAVRYVP
jgi:hypothetical protein